MKEKYVDAFIQSANEVIQEITGITFEKRETQFKDLPNPAYKLSIILSVEGVTSGQVIFSMSEETARIIVAKWLEEDDYSPEGINMLLQSCLGEIGSMITGKSLGKIQIEKELLYIHPPVILTDFDNEFDFTQSDTIVIDMVSDIGSIEISVILTEEEKKEGFFKNIILEQK